MKKNNTLYILIIATIYITSSCGLFSKNNKSAKAMQAAPTYKPNGKIDPFLNELLQKDSFVASILNNPTQYHAQIIYTKIDRAAKNEPTFTTHSIAADPTFYYYPASTIKMPLAFLALQKIKELNAKGINITKDMTMLTGKSTPMQTAVTADSTAPNNKPTIAHYIKQIFLVSDNDASNRLYEFLGQDYVNTNLQKMGFTSAEILHRLSVSLPKEENRITNPIQFVDANGKLVYEQPAQTNITIYKSRNDFRGTGYMKGDVLVNEPFDFSGKNRLCLNDLDGILKAVIFMPYIAANKRFDITEADRKFCLQYMSQVPSQTTYPAYDTKEFFDTYVKFNLYGSQKNTTIPSHIKIFNKVGDAYGYFTDASYIVDFKNNIEYVLSITIYANKDGVFNDDKYEMEEIALPFMKRVGEILYDYEKKRTRNIVNLSEFIMQYDK
jgi:Beta-lactamase enzyme family